jgi:hypothetical protein
MSVKKTDGRVVPQLIVPYTLDTNDMRFSSAQGFAQGDDFFTYLKDSFDVLYAEGDPAGINAQMLSTACIAGCWAGPAACGPCRSFWTTSRAIPTSGFAAGSTSPGTGLKQTPIRPHRQPQAKAESCR